jgi:hypothetical protein
MRHTWWFAALALALVALFAPALDAQTVISNERLVSTTFVVNKENSSTSCTGYYCIATPVPMFKAVHVTCPAALGKTCTLHIFLDAKAEVSDNNNPDGGPGAEGRFQFLVDGNAPIPGPTDGHGFYLFSLYGAEYPIPNAPRQSYSASLVSRVTNSKSKDHTIKVEVSGTDAGDRGYCFVTAHWSTMRIDVFAP